MTEQLRVLSESEAKKIGLIGTNGSGKSAVCDYLNQHGYEVFSLSDIVRQTAKEKGLTLTRDHLVETANTLKSSEGMDVLARRVMTQADGCDRVVFDSVRHPLEAKFLMSQGVTMIGIDAPIETRFERVLLRSRETDQIDFETFVAHDKRERAGQGQRLDEVLSICDILIDNAADLKALNQKLDYLFSFKPSSRSIDK